MSVKNAATRLEFKDHNLMSIEASNDRLSEIKKRWAQGNEGREDSRWLILEVQRLKAENLTLGMLNAAHQVTIKEFGIELAASEKRVKELEKQNQFQDFCNNGRGI